MTVRPEDLAATLIRRRRTQRLAHAQRADALRQLLSQEVRTAVEKALFQRAWLIGSLAYGTFGEASDIDVVVEGLDPEHRAKLWCDWVRELGADVHLLRLEDLPTDFRARVLEEGRPLS